MDELKVMVLSGFMITLLIIGFVVMPMAMSDIEVQVGQAVNEAKEELTEEEMKKVEEVKKQEEEYLRKKKEIEEKEIEKEKEEARKKNKKFTKVFTIVIGLMISVLTLIYGIYSLPYKLINSKVNETKEAWRVRKDVGYKSYKTMMKVIKYLTVNLDKMYIAGKVSSDYLSIKIDIMEIKKNYIGNIEESGIKMYKYEKTFEEVLMTLHRAKKEGVLNDTQVIDTIKDAIVYPYEDIVGDGLASKVVESMKKEIGILKELDKNR